jgi:hypothetical protein
MEQDYDVNLYAPSGGTRTTTKALSCDQIRLNAPNSYTNNLVVAGSIMEIIVQILDLNFHLN